MLMRDSVGFFLVFFFTFNFDSSSSSITPFVLFHLYTPGLCISNSASKVYLIHPSTQRLRLLFVLRRCVCCCLVMVCRCSHCEWVLFAWVCLVEFM